MATKYPIAVGIDAIDGFVAVEGWGEVSSMRATELAKEFANAGVEAIICTDVGKDGTLSGVNVEFTLDIARASKISTIASGGVKDESDINALIETNEIDGVIIGKAYYEGTLDLPKMFKLIL
jgi:phosphoribosylformimino-5-aminoimidazole carboxamide ribotide isomerase